ncbi:response regulator [Acidicapsa dinghuensis]|uniref:Response regulator n=1 Tax=Acidicapsa dinghuensis TaxID=2218256 RepID=A0ABW1E988_9BACT|nr:response regulator [Acidicapsa dinghuensis]
MRVLIVDDHGAQAQGLAELLSIRGYAAWHVSSAEAALRDLDLVNVDVILSDVSLPGMDGYEFCRRIRATPKFDRVAFIYYTGTGEMPGILHGGDAFLTYPVGINQLMSVVTGCIARRAPEKRPATSGIFVGVA